MEKQPEEFLITSIHYFPISDHKCSSSIEHCGLLQYLFGNQRMPKFNSVIRKLILFLCFMALVYGSAFAQADDTDDIRFPSLPYYSYGQGLGLTTPDSTFRFNIRFRLQNRATYFNSDNDDPAIEAVIRRLRLRFDGFVGDPRFLYAIQLSFAPGDVGVITPGDNINIIRDAVFFYRHNDHLNFGFGQTKLPGNRQRVNSSGALQLTDRSINNAMFTIDRDYGVFAYYLNEIPDQFSYNIRTAISTGNGRNWTKSPSTDLSYTARLELFPLGSFRNSGTMFEGDLMREQTPKLLLAGTIHQNQGAQRSRGQLGSTLFETRDLTSAFFDVVLKYNGWALMGAYMTRIADDPITINSDGVIPEFRHVFTGSGYDLQLSYLFLNDYEVIGRYSQQNPHSDIQAFEPDIRQFSFGITRYIWEHSLKLQSEITQTQSTFFTGDKENSWYLRFQVEIGI